MGIIYSQNGLTLNQSLEQHIKGTMNYDAPWYDWFCSDLALWRKGKRLMGRLRGIAKSNKFDGDKTYVWFKNNYSCKSYDDFRISDIETGNVIFTIIPQTPDGKAEVWGKENDFKRPLYVGTWQGAKDWFNGKEGAK